MTESQANDVVRPELTPEFLKTLVTVACIYGHMGDFSEVAMFVHYVHDLADIRAPDLNPMEFSDDR